MRTVSYDITITGVVQGVGFRPFCYHHAQAHRVKGLVQNTPSGVFVHICGTKTSCQSFIDNFLDAMPKGAKVDSFVVKEVPSTQEFDNFTIDESTHQGSLITLPAVDTAVCQSCIDEIHNTSHHRYRYALNSCTFCGPRFSIIKALPFDRNRTAVSAFGLCSACQEEYTNPSFRRYHAQAITCPTCQPSLEYIDGTSTYRDEKALYQAVDAINSAHIVAIKGIGGFHLVCDATNAQAVWHMRTRKQRSAKAFAIICRDIAMAKEYAHINSTQEKALLDEAHPIVLLPLKHATRLTPSVVPFGDMVGIMLAYTPLLHILFDDIHTPLVATSANTKGAPIIHRLDLLKRHAHLWDGILHTTRDIINPIDDSVVMCVDEHTITLRLGRGLAPFGIALKKRLKKPILAVGAHQKNSVALAFEQSLIVAPFVGDLEHIDTIDAFKERIDTLTALFGVTPHTVVHDLHSLYESTHYARSLKLENTQSIAHHYAHILSVMAEHGRIDDVLGVAFDGTGLGVDGTLWGGEFLRANTQGFTRITHLKPFKLLHPAKAIKEPRLSALGLWLSYFDSTTLPNEITKNFSSLELERALHAHTHAINTLDTSSIGRLFDAVASVLNLVHISSFEGQSGVLLQACAHREDVVPYSYTIDEEGINIGTMLYALVHDTQSLSIKSARFFRTLAQIIVDIALKNSHLAVVLSGGVFQNHYFLSMVLPLLKAHNITYMLPKRVPINDGGIALGQAWYAVHHNF